MSQAPNWEVPTTGPMGMSTYSARMQPLLDALRSAHIGDARPDYAVAGTIWISNANPASWAVNVFDGGQDVAIALIDPASHAMVIQASSIPALPLSRITGLTQALADIEGDVTLLQIAIGDLGPAADLAIATAAQVRAGTPGGAVTPNAVLEAMGWVALAPAANVAIDHAAGVNRTLFCNQNTVIGVPTNARPGWHLSLRIVTNGFDVSWAEPNPADPAFLWGVGDEPFIPQERALVNFVCLEPGRYLCLGGKEF